MPSYIENALTAVLNAVNAGEPLRRVARDYAFITSIVNLIISLIIYILFDFSNNQFQFVQEHYDLNFFDVYLRIDFSKFLFDLIYLFLSLLFTFNLYLHFYLYIFDLTLYIFDYIYSFLISLLLFRLLFIFFNYIYQIDNYKQLF